MLSLREVRQATAPITRSLGNTRPVKNWAKASELFGKHAKSKWHLASTETQALSELAEQHGDVMDRMLAASELERRQNRELMKKLMRSLYFLVRHRIPHTTTFKDLIKLQIENGNGQLKMHKDKAPSNVTYLSNITIADLLKSISHVIEHELLMQMQASPFFSIMADESTDIASMEELSICGRWLFEGEPVEHFLGIVHAKEVTAEAITTYLLQFFTERGLFLKKLRGLGFDGASTMSGEKSGVQVRLRVYSPTALYVHCRCHQLQLAAIHASKEHNEVKRVLGTLLTIWKTFHYSPKKAETLVEIQAVLNSPEIRVNKPSDTRWLAQERCVRAVRLMLPALVETFEKIYEYSGDAEAYGIAKLICTYKFVACLYMLCDVLHTLAKLHCSFQSKDLDLATVPTLIQCTLSRLMEIKECVLSSTWFKDHIAVFTDSSQLGTRNINVSDNDQDYFITNVYRPYNQSVIDHIRTRLRSSDVFSAFSIFDPSNLPNSKESLSSYGMDTISVLTDFYGKEQQVKFQDYIGHSSPDVDLEQTKAEWKIFRRIMFAKFKKETSPTVLRNVLASDTLSAGFPNLVKLASIAVVLPVTTATVERTFSDIKMVKTRLRSRLGEDTLDYALRICIEGPETLDDETLECIISHWKDQKKRRIVL